MKPHYILLFLAFVFDLSAQAPWTLDQCIQYAYNNNIQLKQQQLQADLAGNVLFQSKMALFPAINASAEYTLSKGKVLDQNTFTIVEGETVKSLSGGISGEVTLFSGLQQKNKIRKNEFSLLANIQHVEKLKNDLSINIALYYLQILHAMEQLKVAADQLALTRLQVDRMDKMVKAGSIPAGELSEIKSQAAREVTQVAVARNTLILAKLDLAQLLDLENTEDFQVVVPDLQQVNISGLGITVDDIFAIADSTLPQIKVVEYNSQATAQELAITKGARSPRLILSGGYSTRYSSSASIADPTGTQLVRYSFWDQLRDGVNSYIGLGLSIPVFNGWQVSTSVKNAKINLQISQYEEQLAKNTLYKEIQQAYTDAVAALNKYDASLQAVVSTQEAFGYTAQRYEAGVSPFVDYSTAKNRLTTVQSELLQAKFEYIFKIKILDFYNGHPITL